MLQDGRGVLFGQGVLECERKGGPSGDGAWFVIGGGLGVLVGSGSMSFA